MPLEYYRTGPHLRCCVPQYRPCGLWPVPALTWPARRPAKLQIHETERLEKRKTGFPEDGKRTNSATGNSRPADP